MAREDSEETSIIPPCVVRVVLHSFWAGGRSVKPHALILQLIKISALVGTHEGILLKDALPVSSRLDRADVEVLALQLHVRVVAVHPTVAAEVGRRWIRNGLAVGSRDRVERHRPLQAESRQNDLGGEQLVPDLTSEHGVVRHLKEGQVAPGGQVDRGASLSLYGLRVDAGLVQPFRFFAGNGEVGISAGLRLLVEHGGHRAGQPEANALRFAGALSELDTTADEVRSAARSHVSVRTIGSPVATEAAARRPGAEHGGAKSECFI